jgi:hypothetical protein
VQVHVDECISGLGADGTEYRVLLRATHAKPREFGIIIPGLIDNVYMREFAKNPIATWNGSR